MAGDPDAATRSILKALPNAGADVIELGMPFTDPMADGPAIQAPAQRALKAGQTMEQDARHGARASARRDDATPIVLMGYYNPIYIYGVDSFLADAKAGRRRRADHRRPAARGGRGAVPAGAEGRAQLHPAGDADHRRQAPAGGAREHLGLRLLRLDHRHHRRGRARRRQRSRAAVARIKRHTKLPVCVGFGVKHRRAGARDRRRAPTASWSARRWSTR